MPQFFYQPSSIISILCVGLVLLIYINRFKLKQMIHQFRTQRCLANLGLDQIQDLSCPDGLDNYFNIDRLILLDHAILIINHKRFPGKIYGSEHIDEWTQILGQKSYKFPNPLFTLNLQLQALQKCIPDSPVEARLFFDNSAEFPKQIPPQILHPLHIEKRFFSNSRHKVNSDIMQAWKKLQQMKSEPLV